MVEVKLCGLTRAEDAAVAGALGVAFVGVVFAGGPRRLAPAAARLVLDGARAAGAAAPRRVGVFGDQGAAEIADVAAVAGLDVLQLHGTSDAATVAALRRAFRGEIWRVVRLGPGAQPGVVRDAAAGVDAVLVDALVQGTLGGAGVTVDWTWLASTLNAAGRPARLVLAGGLRPENVHTAVGVVAPDAVDVSSGIESSVGIKDHAKMRAFVEAVARGGR